MKQLLVAETAERQLPAGEPRADEAGLALSPP